MADRKPPGLLPTTWTRAKAHRSLARRLVLVTQSRMQLLEIVCKIRNGQRSLADTGNCLTWEELDFIINYEIKHRIALDEIGAQTTDEYLD
jgi:O-succinylbenzoate synthase